MGFVPWMSSRSRPASMLSHCVKRSKNKCRHASAQVSLCSRIEGPPCYVYKTKPPEGPEQKSRRADRLSHGREQYLHKPFPVQHKRRNCLRFVEAPTPSLASQKREMLLQY